MEGIQDSKTQFLEQKLKFLEGQIATLYTYIGTSNGDLFASANQVNRIEESVYKNQLTIDEIKKQTEAITADLSSYIDTLFQEISKGRGTRGTDIQLFVKFTTTQLTEAIQKLHTKLYSTLQELIPYTKLQELEKHLLLKQRQTSSLEVTQDEQRLSQLETRLGLLEFKNTVDSNLQSNLQSVSESSTHYTEIIQGLKERIEYLEKQAFSQLDKVHKSVSRPFVDSGPLITLQSQVAVLQSDLQSVRGELSKRSVESLIFTTVSNMKESLETQLSEKLKELDEIRAHTTTLIEEAKAELTSFDHIRTDFKRMNTTYEDLKGELETLVETWLEKRIHTAQDTIKKTNAASIQEIEATVKNAFLTNSGVNYTKLLEDYLEGTYSGKLRTEIETYSVERGFITKDDHTVLQTDTQTLKTGLTDLQETLQEQIHHSLERWNEVGDLILKNQTETGKLQKTMQTSITKIRDIQEEQKELETSINTKYIQNIQSYVETQFPILIRNQLNEYILKAGLINRDELYGFQSDIKSQMMSRLDNVYTTISKHQKDIQKLQFTMNSFQIQLRNIESEQKRLDTIVTSMNGNPSELLNIHSMMIKSKDTLYSSLTKCFFTALIGKSADDVDVLESFERIPGWDYICFTNLDIRDHTGWKLIRVPLVGNDPVMCAKWYKWNSHKVLGDYDVAVWMDAYLSPNPMYVELLKYWILQMLEQDTLILHRPHAERRCIWEECDAVLETRRAKPENVEKVRNTLFEIDMPKQYGLYDTNVMIKLHKNQQLQTISEKIYSFMQEHSNRDQLAVTAVYYLNTFNQTQIQNLFRIVNPTGIHKRRDAF